MGRVADNARALLATILHCAFFVLGTRNQSTPVFFQHCSRLTAAQKLADIIGVRERTQGHQPRDFRRSVFEDCRFFRSDALTGRECDRRTEQSNANRNTSDDYPSEPFKIATNAITETRFGTTVYRIVKLASSPNGRAIPPHAR